MLPIFVFCTRNKFTCVHLLQQVPYFRFRSCCNRISAIEEKGSSIAALKLLHSNIVQKLCGENSPKKLMFLIININNYNIG